MKGASRRTKAKSSTSRVARVASQSRASTTTSSIAALSTVASTQTARVNAHTKKTVSVGRSSSITLSSDVNSTTSSQSRKTFARGYSTIPQAMVSSFPTTTKQSTMMVKQVQQSAQRTYTSSSSIQQPSVDAITAQSMHIQPLSLKVVPQPMMMKNSNQVLSSSTPVTKSYGVTDHSISVQQYKKLSQSTQQPMMMYNDMDMQLFTSLTPITPAYNTINSTISDMQKIPQRKTRFATTLADNLVTYSLDNVESIMDDGNDMSPSLELMNRNKRRPKKANHGARPCSSFARARRRLRRHNSTKK